MKLAPAKTLVAWLWDQNPAVVYALYQAMPRAQPLGDDGDISIDLGSDTPDFGSSFDFSSDPTVSLDAPTLDSSVFDTPGSAALGLDDSSFDLSSIPTLGESDLAPIDTSALDSSVGSSSTGTSITATDSATSSALSGVADFLTSSAGLTALAKVTQSIFQAQAAGSSAAAAQARMQAAIINSQTARAATGSSALPVQYVSNGIGGVTPVLATKSGYVPLTTSVLNSFTPSSIEAFVAQNSTWLLIGGAAAVLLYAISRRRSP